MAKPVTLPEDLNRERVLDAHQVAALCGFSVVTLNRQQRAKKFPTPIKLGERKRGWKAGVVLDHISEKAA